MFKEQKDDLESSVLSDPESTNRKISEKARWEDVWVREAEAKEFSHTRKVSNI